MSLLRPTSLSINKISHFRISSINSIQIIGCKYNRIRVCYKSKSFLIKIGLFDRMSKIEVNIVVLSDSEKNLI